MGQGKISINSILWIILWIFSNIIFVFVGLKNAAPGALATITIDILWPIILLLVVSQIYTIDFFVELNKVILIFSIILCLYDFGFVIKTFWISQIPDFLYSFHMSYAIGRKGVLIEYSLDHFYSLYFVVPYTYGLVITSIRNKRNDNKIVLIAILVLEIICIFLTGKTTALIIICLMPVLHYVLSFLFLGRRRKTHSIMFKILLSIVVALFMTIIFFKGSRIVEIVSVNVEKILTMFTNTSDERYSQFRALLKGWTEAPILGNGTGSYSKECIRSAQTPWAYELSYLSILFQKGLIGLGIFLSYTIWIIKNMLVLSERDEVFEYTAIPFLLGFIGILISNAINPTLGKAGYIWIFFLPLAFFNIEKIRKTKE
jgi:O-Antigen ligase.